MPDSFTDMLRAAPRSERRRLLEQAAAAEIREILQMAPDEPVPPTESVFSLGLGSLGVVDLKERLEARFGCVIDADVLFSHPTLANLMDHLTQGQLRDLFPGDSEPDPSTPDASTTALVDDFLKTLYQR
ncbi:acyl carrier protein [Actinoplanes sp. NPDC049802]|uniref:acyl carrier protein n=1 Tax=Actinoplanes sp. NPDC049802 TaxID=3154742 RepID=UPI0033FF1227